jgi:hypothetical protein
MAGIMNTVIKVWVSQKGRVFINQVRHYGLFEEVVLRSELLIHSTLHDLSVCYSHPQEFLYLVTT